MVLWYVLLGGIGGDGFGLRGEGFSFQLAQATWN